MCAIKITRVDWHLAVEKVIAIIIRLTVWATLYLQIYQLFQTVFSAK